MIGGIVMFSRKKRAEKRPDYNNKLLDQNTPFAITEAFKMLRTNLHYTSKNEACPVFAITSAYAHAGKSIIIANTALSYAQLDKKVLLIDADMRCPVINKIFCKKSLNGLSDFLASSGTDASGYGEFLTETGIRGLDIMTSGRIPPNPSELLASPRLKSLLDEAKKTYDYIFIDLPPVCEVSDAGVLANNVTGYIFAVRSGATDSRAVADALESLKQKDANVVGFVLNDVNLKTNGKYYKYGKYGKYVKYGKYAYARNYANAKAEQDEEK